MSRRQPEPPCPRQGEHTPAPEDYRSRHAWAEEMAATQDQRRCPGCGRWSIWVACEPVTQK